MSRGLPTNNRSLMINRRSLARRVVPDSAIYRWWAGNLLVNSGQTASPWPEEIANQDATAVGNPIYRSNHSGFPTVEYDGNDDGHTWSPSDQLPTGTDEFSILAMVYPNTLDGDDAILFYGEGSPNSMNSFNLDSGNVQHEFYDNNIRGNISLTASEWNTVGIAYDGSERRLFVNGSLDVSDQPGSVEVHSADHSIGYRRSSVSDRHFNGYISEVILCNSAEDPPTFSTYNTLI